MLKHDRPILYKPRSNIYNMLNVFLIKKNTWIAPRRIITPVQDRVMSPCFLVTLVTKGVTVAKTTITAVTEPRDGSWSCFSPPHARDCVVSCAMCVLFPYHARE